MHSDVTLLIPFQKNIITKDDMSLCNLYLFCICLYSDKLYYIFNFKKHEPFDMTSRPRSAPVTAPGFLSPISCVVLRMLLGIV